MADEIEIKVEEPEVITEDAPVAPEVEDGEKGEEEAAPAAAPEPAPEEPETLKVGA